MKWADDRRQGRKQKPTSPEEKRCAEREALGSLMLDGAFKAAISQPEGILIQFARKLRTTGMLTLKLLSLNAAAH
jgi:hypothetical protein